MTSLNEQYRRTLAFQASGEYLMNHIAGVMEMVQDKRALHDEELDEETLVTIEAQVKTIAEELTYQSQGQLVGVHRTKGEPSLSMERRKDKTDDNDRSIFRASQ
jgi:hypothetical protein